MDEFISWIWANAEKITVIFMLLAIGYGGSRGFDKSWWVFGWVYRERINDLETQLFEEKNESATWKDLALRGTVLAHQSADVAEEAVLVAENKAGVRQRKEVARQLRRTTFSRPRSDTSKEQTRRSRNKS